MVSSQIALKPTDEGDLIQIAGDVLIGRGEDCDLVVQEGHLSRQHARLTLKEGEVWLEDLESTNGTYVNDHRITAPTALGNGDRVRFDTVEFNLVVEASADDKTYVRPGESAETPATSKNRTVISDAVPAKKPPGAWADPDYNPTGRTRFLTRDELQKELDEEFAATGPVPDIEQPYLQILSGESAGENLKLEGSENSNRWVVGSEEGDEAIHILLKDEGVSSKHAQFTNEGGRWKLSDLMSANGTYVNGKKTNISYLSSEDRIRIGLVECIFHIPARKRSGGGRPRTRLVAIIVLVVVAALVAALMRWYLA